MKKFFKMGGNLKLIEKGEMKSSKAKFRVFWWTFIGPMKKWCQTIDKLMRIT